MALSTIDVTLRQQQWSQTVKHWPDPRSDATSLRHALLSTIHSKWHIDNNTIHSSVCLPVHSMSMHVLCVYHRQRKSQQLQSVSDIIVTTGSTAHA